MKFFRTFFLTIFFVVGALHAKAQWTQINETFGNGIVICMKAMNNELFAGTLYSYNTGTVYKSIDDGLTWSVSNSGLDSSYGCYVKNFAVIDSVIFAATCDYYGTNSGVFRSLDHGNTWVRVLGNLNNASFRVATKDSTVFAISEEGSLYRSVDMGANWTTIYNFAPSPFICLTTDSATVYFSGTSILMFSTDNGSTWSAGNNPYAFSQLIARFPFVYSRSGTYVGRSSDNGVTWVDISGIPSGYPMSGGATFCGNKLVIPSMWGVFITPDDGLNWYCAGLDNRMDEGSACIETFHNYLFAGGWRMFRIDTSQVSYSGVGIETNQFSEGLNIYPNPGNGKFSVNLDEQNLFSDLLVLNVLGEIVFQKKLTKENEIDLSFLPAEIYFLKFQRQDGSTVCEKLVIE